MKKIFVCLLLVAATVISLCTLAIAETLVDSGTAQIAGSVLSAATMDVAIINRQTQATDTSIAFNGGVPIAQSTSPKWLLADQIIRIDYQCNESSWAIRMVTNNIVQFPGIEYQNSIDGTTRWTGGLIKAADDIYNRARIAWQIYDEYTTQTSPLDDNHIYGYDANEDGDLEDPGDIARVWGLVNDKGDSSYAGWDGNNDGDYLDTTGLDLNADEDYLDEGEYPPDTPPDPTSAYHWVLYGVGSNSFPMPYPDTFDGDGDVYVYFGSDLGDGVAAGAYQATINVELYHE